jgi:hypothetical protein
MPIINDISIVARLVSLMSCRDTRRVHLDQGLNRIMGIPAEFKQLQNTRDLRNVDHLLPTSGSHFPRELIFLIKFLSISWLVEPDQGGSKY